MNKKKIKVCHITTVHSRSDIRIFYKECRSLSDFGFDVTLIVADSKGDERINEITIHDVGKSNGRFKRLVLGSLRVFVKSLAIRADVYHFHDPELIFTMLALKILRYKIVFDAHEDYEKSILSNDGINKYFRTTLSLLTIIIEKLFYRFFTGIIAATPSIYSKYKAINSNVFLVQNFPVLYKFTVYKNMVFNRRPNNTVYAGSISIARGIKEMVEALEIVNKNINCTLTLCGLFSPSSINNEVSKLNGFKYTDYKGQLSVGDVFNIYSDAIAGLVLYHPTPDHIDSQPNKMFEYMASKLPVIASDFPLWDDIISTYKCGLTVDPLDPSAIADAILFLIDNPSEAKLMGGNGYNTVIQKFNWNNEKEVLKDFYLNLLE